MRFAEPWWLFGAALALLVAVFYILGGVRLLAALKRFGEPDTLRSLVTARAGGRRATKGALVVLSVVLAFFAIAGPQYGRGTRLIPATNLDCVIVLDYSKSMYARDIAPNRSERAKAEVARLIGELPGARFGAVAFAGEPLSFPLTSDGPAIAQFLRQNTPNDMPIGGTAIARALEAARDLLARDPLSAKHQKVSSDYQTPPESYLITEDTPLDNPLWEYSRNKIACENYLRDQCHTNGFPVTIVRPSHTYDDRYLPVAVHGSKGSWQVVDRIMRGKPVLIHGDVPSP